MEKRLPDEEKQKPIDRWSPVYSWLRVYISFCLKKIYYRRVQVFHEGELPANIPLILAPNHQNALMDALNVLTNLRQQPVFLARADLFRKPAMAKLLTSLKLTPIFRIRDGKETLKQNDEVFESSVGILERKNIITMFPEGNHGDREILRVLKKGIPRIAFLSEQKHLFTLGLRIIPVGITYSNYYKFRSSVFIYFGKPFGIDDFRQSFEKNPPLAFTAFNEKLAEELKKVMIHIDDDRQYQSLQLLREIDQNRLLSEKKIRKGDLKALFFASKKIISKLENFRVTDDAGYQKIIEKAETYRRTLRKLKLDDKLLSSEKPRLFTVFMQTVTMTILSPVFIYGFVFNFLPYKIPLWFCKSKIKDKQFYSSVAFGFSALLTFPLFYFVYLILALSLVKFSTALILFLLLPVTGLFAHYYSECSGILLKCFRMRFSGREYQAKLLDAYRLRKEIISGLDRT